MNNIHKIFKRLNHKPINTFSKNSLITPANRSSLSISKAWILAKSASNLEGVNLFRIPRTVLSIAYNVIQDVTQIS